MLEEENKVVNTESASPAAEPAKDEAKQDAPRGDRKPFNRGDKKNFRNRRNNRDKQDKEFEERVVSINRVSKTVQGGRRMRFSALVVIGDKKGRYGFGTGKAGEVPDAIKKALESAKKNVCRVSILKDKGDTIPHEIIGEFGACKVFLKPAKEGTGIIAGGPVRAILELAGVRNVYSKVYGSRSPINVIRATNNGLQSLKTYTEIKSLRKHEDEVKE